MEYNGALPSQLIMELVKNGFIEDSKPKNVCTDTYDVVTTDEVWRLPGAFLPKHGERVEDFLRSYGRKISPNTILEKGGCYIFLVRERIAKAIPGGFYGYSNPKSNIGRVDVLTRVLVDGISRYDYIPPGYVGPIWTMIEPTSFAIIAKGGVSFNQIRFINQKTRLDEYRLGTTFDADGGMLFTPHGRQILYNEMEHRDNDGSILLTLGFDFPIIGYEAVENGEPIDLSLENHYDPRDFFRQILSSNGSFNFSRDSFYILSSDESVRVPAGLACEMRPMDERSGEFRTHYAGYIAPGWGMGADGSGKGKPLTLECRFYSPVTVRRGQPFAKIRFERMKEEPEVHYDQQPGIKFKVQQGPGLAKYFKEW